MQAVLGEFFTGKFSQVTIPNDDASRRRAIEPRDQIQHRRFAGPGTAEERDKFSGANLERDAIDRADYGFAHAVVAAKIFTANGDGTAPSRHWRGCRHTR